MSFAQGMKERRKEKREGRASSSSAHSCISFSFPPDFPPFPFDSTDLFLIIPSIVLISSRLPTTSAISKTFCFDLLIDPKSRGVDDLAHKIVAVGSRSVEKADQFIDENGIGTQAKGYGSYQGVEDDQVSLCEGRKRDEGFEG